MQTGKNIDGFAQKREKTRPGKSLCIHSQKVHNKEEETKVNYFLFEGQKTLKEKKKNEQKNAPIFMHSISIAQIRL